MLASLHNNAMRNTMTPENIKVLEVIYWVVAFILILVVWFVMTRRSRAASEYHAGRDEGRRYLRDGISTTQIESFLRMKRDGGLYGPFESGIASVLDEVTK